MKYTILIERYAQKQLMKMDKQVIPAIKVAIGSLADNPRPYGYKKLKGEAAYRIRVGNYRVIYEINDDIILVTVVSVAHRKDFYK
jgi:mRNA interferase RelE/StbE